MRRSKLSVAAWQIGILLLVLVAWEWAGDLRRMDSLKPFVPTILEPYYISKPSMVWESFVRLGCLRDSQGAWIVGTGFGQCLKDTENNLWAATLFTLKNTWWGFVFGTLLGVAAGLVLGRSDYLTRIFEPYITALNSMPRIAIVPLIILMFGLGDMSKIVTAITVVFFVVFYNTFEGTRAVDRDQVSAARLLGASEWTVLRTVVIPSAIAWVFASLTPAVSFALIGVIVGEFIGAERGIGKLIIEAEGRANASDMMVAILVLMVVGTVLSVGVRRLQSYLLSWQPQFESRA
jgi:NitT/TauT family transport system permease protein